MRFFISQDRCDNCQLCVLACSTQAIRANGEFTPKDATPIERFYRRTISKPPTIDQDRCDGCPDNIVPNCVAVCDLAAVNINMLV
jgi:Fe-S-cluster-containing hydrogenase component 2